MYDSELPAGFQDADFEMAELQASANTEQKRRRRGVCSHGWTGPHGEAGRVCFHCGATFKSDDDCRRAYDLIRAGLEDEAQELVTGFCETAKTNPRHRGRK